MAKRITKGDDEDSLLAHSPQIRRKIEAGLKDIREGKTIPLGEYLKRRAMREANRLHAR